MSEACESNAIIMKHDSTRFTLIRHSGEQIREHHQSLFAAEAESICKIPRAAVKAEHWTPPENQTGHDRKESSEQGEPDQGFRKTVRVKTNTSKKEPVPSTMNNFLNHDQVRGNEARREKIKMVEKE